MDLYSHGGDIWGREGEILDFSANLNPLGMPLQVAQAVAEAAKNSDIYPDPLCRQLSRKIGERDAVSPDWVVCGNGAADLIFRLCVALKPKKALITAPTFSEYEESLSWVDCQVTRHLLLPEENFDLTDLILNQISADLDILFLCSPNNPTGRLISEDLIQKILQKTHQNNIILVVDECFLPLSTGGTGLTPWLAEYPNLFLLRAFTKSYAMAGLRLGYGLCSDLNLRGKIQRCGQPWAVSTPAQMAGLAALDLPEWPAEARELLEIERPKLIENLRQLGLTVWESQANYLLFKSKKNFDLKAKLLEKNILIRSCSNYFGLNQDCYRVCIKTREENQILLKALEEVLL